MYDVQSSYHNVTLIKIHLHEKSFFPSDILDFSKKVLSHILRYFLTPNTSKIKKYLNYSIVAKTIKFLDK